MTYFNKPIDIKPSVQLPNELLKAVIIQVDQQNQYEKAPSYVGTRWNTGLKNKNM